MRVGGDRDDCSCETTFAYLSTNFTSNISLLLFLVLTLDCSLLCIQSHCENNIPRALPTNVLASSLLCPVTASGRRSTEAMGTLQATMTTAMVPNPRKVRTAVASYLWVHEQNQNAKLRFENV